MIDAAAQIFQQTDRELWLVTSRDESRRGGLIATFVCQASLPLELPRVATAIARHHHTWELIQASGAFALHLLGEEQLDWVWRFGLQSGRRLDKLKGLACHLGVTGSPLLADALGWLDCRVETHLDTGDRTLYLAEVVDARLNRSARPLTMQRLLQLAPPEKLAELRRQREADSQTDAEAIRAWRRDRAAAGGSSSMKSNPSSRSQTRLVLASGSPRRRELLTEAGYAFEVVVPSEVAECGVCSGESPPEMVARLAWQKAADVGPRIGRGLIIACDTVAECQGQVLGKPANEAQARRMLEMLNGREHRVYSGLCLWPWPEGEPEVEVEKTTLRMEPLSPQQIDDYLASGQWEGKAGGFGYQDRLGWAHVVEGSESNVVGLPMELLREMLGQ